jgi:hypothetical protein
MEVSISGAMARQCNNITNINTEVMLLQVALLVRIRER